MIISIVLSLIFITLAVIHFNWAIGGKFGFTEALPTNKNGERVLNPKKIDSVIVAIVLTFFAFFYIIQSGLLHYNLPNWVLKYGSWIIPSIFILRAIGDFKYVGFFKQIKTSKFGKLDTKFFSPLCLLIGILGITLQLLK